VDTSFFVYEWFLSRISRGRRLDRELRRPLQHFQECELRLHPLVCRDRVGQLPIHRVAARQNATAGKRRRSDRREENSRPPWYLAPSANRESLAVLRWIYYADDVTCLTRKRLIAAPFLAACRAPAVRRPGRPV